jgi:hypothetical protein
MEIKPIKTEQNYNNSIGRIEELWGAKKDQYSQIDVKVKLLIKTIILLFNIKSFIFN